ncbi:MAG: hydroxymethylglutaryl-CoA lyase, partial [Bacteroidetes bacterium]
LQAGFDTLDFGSFVSPKAIPQMRDTAEVLAHLDLSRTRTKLLAIVANQRGADTAVQFPQIQYLGFPFSVSETFQRRNTNAGIEESLERLKAIQELCLKHDKEMVLYVSMGFGNPYGDPWNAEVVMQWVAKLAGIGIKIFQLSDTIGVARPPGIAYLFGELIPAYPELEIGAHFHTTSSTWLEKIRTAYEYGCRRFDGAIRGYGGCPMAKDELTGNMPMEHLVHYFAQLGVATGVDPVVFDQAYQLAAEVFPQH